MKKLVYILAVSAVTFSFSGCTKDNQQFTPACETNNTGTLKVVCNLEDPYKVYLNNAYKGTVGAYTSKDFGDITSGTYSTRYEQASGYVFYPTEYTASVTITRCQTKQINLP